MKNDILNITFVLALFLPLPAKALDVYQMDPAHSAVNFSVSHLVVSTTFGGFGDISGTVALDKNDLSGSQINVSIAAASINTHTAARDEHLKSSDFLDVSNHPHIVFKSSRIIKSAEGYWVTGRLTLRGVSREISFPITISGPVTHPFNGQEVIGLSGSTIINRQDYGLSWNKQLDRGGVMVGDEVTIDFSVEAVRQPSVAPINGT